MFIEKLITILLSWNNLKKRIFIAVMDILMGARVIEQDARKETEQ